jgi:hypothetical protein
VGNHSDLEDNQGSAEGIDHMGDEENSEVIVAVANESESGICGGARGIDAFHGNGGGHDCGFSSAPCFSRALWALISFHDS